MVGGVMNRKWRLVILAVLLLTSTACGGQSQNKDQVIKPTTVSSREGAYFVINEVGLGPNGFVALTNFTDVPAHLGGLYLCQGSKCFELPDDVVNPNDTVRIAVGDGVGLEKVVASHADLGELRPADGEIALSTGGKIDDPGQILFYLEWGSTPHELTSMAIKAGLWMKGSYAPTSPTATRLFRVEETGLWLFDEP